MPVTLKLPLPGGGTLALWKIDEPEPVLAALCTEAERRTATGFSSEARRRESLAWHALLHALVPGREAGYDHAGGPILLPLCPAAPVSATREAAATATADFVDHADFAADSPHGPEAHIGVSHTTGWVAVIVAPRRCAVDIEPTDRNFARVVSRYIAPEEEALRGDLPPQLFAAAVWCAKEAAYKWLRREGVDFLKDIRITSLRGTLPSLPLVAEQAIAPTLTIEATVAGHTLQLHGLIAGDLCCVYAGGNPLTAFGGGPKDRNE